MERIRTNTISPVINVNGKIMVKGGYLTVRIPLNEKTLRQLYKEEESSSLSLSATKTKKPDKDKRNNKYLPLAKQLSKIIQTKKKISHTMPQIRTWANEIRRIEEEMHVEYNRIEDVLDWYENNIGREYVPVIESGYSLRTKFMRIEDAMNRKEIKPNKPPIYDDGIKYVYDSKIGKYKHSRTGEIYIP